MEILIASYVFILGIIFGSFALAMVDRMRAKKDWVRGRSECEHCKHVLRPIDLIPLVSWVSQKGRCRYCHKKLSAAYPMAELGLGVVFLGSFVFFPYELTAQGIALLCLWLIAMVICCGLFIFDVRWFLLPNKLVYPLVAVALVHKLVFLVGRQDLLEQIVVTMLSLAISAGFFFVLYLVSRGKWIGDGDIRLGVAIGLFVEGPAEAWFALFVASTVGVLIAMPKLVRDRKAMKLKLPFGPMLMAGLYVSYLFGPSLIDWYSRTFLYFN